MGTVTEEDFLVTAGSIIWIQFLYGHDDCEAQQRATR